MLLVKIIFSVSSKISIPLPTNKRGKKPPPDETNFNIFLSYISISSSITKMSICMSSFYNSDLKFKLIQIGIKFYF
jgi:hypothetical protein